MSERDETTRPEEEETAVAEVEAFPESIQPVVDVLRAEYPDIQLAMRGDGWLEAHIGPERSPDFFEYIKDTPGLEFDYLSDVTAVDYEGEGFQVVYHLLSLGRNVDRTQRRLVVKLNVPREKPHTPSVVHLWPTADFHEREVYDLMGIVFDGHPDLRRILMREDWVGHPLRKDYVDRRPPRPRVVANFPGSR